MSENHCCFACRFLEAVDRLNYPLEEKIAELQKAMTAELQRRAKK